MSPVEFPPNFYLRWRLERINRSALAEKANQAPPEALLQQVWLHQRLLRDRLFTVDGRSVQVLHPGFWNQEPGPDLRKALVRIGDGAPVAGDVEIDIVPAGWRQHAHEGNPAYKNVVLHVTWEPGTNVSDLPMLCLKHALDSTVPELTFWLGIEPKPLAEALAGKCSGPLRELDPAAVRQIMRQAAHARLLCKAEQLQARARIAGLEGALSEGLFAGLGYKRNSWPMRKVAEFLPLLKEDLASNHTVLHLQSRLLGVSGLLPSGPGKVKPGEPYLRQVWDFWWRDRDRFADFLLPLETWTLGGIRPANHPQRRLALAAHWAAGKDFIARLENWMARKIESPDLISTLEEILQAPEDPFWSYHFTLSSKALSKPQALLGEQRVTDLAMNVIIPWLYLRALAGRNESVARAAEARYFLWPPGEDNSVLRLARARLFGGVPASFLKSAAEQQALVQIVRDFCDHSNAACHQCPFPEFVAAAATAGDRNACAC